MPIFAYQSFNANTSSTHNIQSFNSQRFTAMGHDHFASQSAEPRVLIFPTHSDGPPTEAVEGPAQLLKAAQEGAMAKGQNSDQHFLGMVTEKVLQIQQGVIRAMGAAPDVLTFGELDSSHHELAFMTQCAGPFTSGSSTAKKACQNFSVHSKTGTNVQPLGEGEGWQAIEYLNFIVVFVHVPNAIAKNSDEVIMFYGHICNQIGGKTIDLVMGDTNQSSAAVTPACVSHATGKKFEDAHPKKNIRPMDTFNIEMFGTNAKSTEKYDVAVYNTETVKLIKMDYWTPQALFGSSSSVAAVTDHMGMAISVEKSGTTQ